MTAATGLALAVDREALADALGALASTVPTRAVLPLTSCVLLAARGDALELRTTTLEQETSYLLRLDEPLAAGGACAVPFRLLHEVVGAYPAKTVRLEQGGTDLRLSAGTYASRLKVYEAGELPASMAVDAAAPRVEVGAARLRDALARVAFAAARTDDRVVLNGVLVRVREGTLHLAAADGFRLALAPNRDAIAPDQAIEAIVPLRAVKGIDAALARAGEAPARLAVDATGKARLEVAAGPVRFVTRLTDGTFPDWTTIIPTEHAWSATVDVEPLAAAVRAADLVARGVAHLVRVTAGDGVLVVTAAASEVGDSSTTVPADFAGDVAGESFAANATYLVEVLGALCAPRARVLVAGPGRPLVFEPVDGDGYRAIVMPMATPVGR